MPSETVPLETAIWNKSSVEARENKITEIATLIHNFDVLTSQTDSSKFPRAVGDWVVTGGKVEHSGYDSKGLPIVTEVTIGSGLLIWKDTIDCRLNTRHIKLTNTYRVILEGEEDHWDKIHVQAIQSNYETRRELYSSVPGEMGDTIGKEVTYAQMEAAEQALSAPLLSDENVEANLLALYQYLTLDSSNS